MRVIIIIIIIIIILKLFRATFTLSYVLQISTNALIYQENFLTGLCIFMLNVCMCVCLCVCMCIHSVAQKCIMVLFLPAITIAIGFRWNDHTCMLSTTMIDNQKLVFCRVVYSVFIRQSNSTLAQWKKLIMILLTAHNTFNIFI